MKIGRISQGLQAAAALDLIFYNYRDFTLAGQSPRDTRAYVGALSVTALF